MGVTPRPLNSNINLEIDSQTLNGAAIYLLHRSMRSWTSGVQVLRFPRSIAVGISVVVGGRVVFAVAAVVVVVSIVVSLAFVVVPEAVVGAVVEAVVEAVVVAVAVSGLASV